MTAITHDYFGEFDSTSSICWEHAVMFNEETLDMALWGDEHGQDVSIELLNEFSEICKNLKRYDKKSRDALLMELTSDPEFIEFHVEEAPDAPVIERLLGQGLLDCSEDEQASRFVSAMKLHNVSFWIENESVTMDYMIDREHTDAVLAVKLNAGGDIASVDWES